jgi:hypothetical protein
MKECKAIFLLWNVGNTLSRYNELDAGDELCKPLKPFLHAILRVRGYYLF